MTTASTTDTVGGVLCETVSPGQPCWASAAAMPASTGVDASEAATTAAASASLPCPTTTAVMLPDAEASNAVAFDSSARRAAGGVERNSPEAEEEAVTWMRNAETPSEPDRAVKAAAWPKFDDAASADDSWKVADTGKSEMEVDSDEAGTPSAKASAEVAAARKKEEGSMPRRVRGEEGAGGGGAGGDGGGGAGCGGNGGAGGGGGGAEVRATSVVRLR